MNVDMDVVHGGGANGPWQKLLVDLGLQYVQVSRAEEMRRGVRGGRSEGRFTRGSTRPLIRQDARGERSQKTCETRNKKAAL